MLLARVPIRRMGRGGEHQPSVTSERSISGVSGHSGRVDQHPDRALHLAGAASVELPLPCECRASNPDAVAAGCAAVTTGGGHAHAHLSHTVYHSIRTLSMPPDLTSADRMSASGGEGGSDPGCMGGCVEPCGTLVEPLGSRFHTISGVHPTSRNLCGTCGTFFYDSLYACAHKGRAGGRRFHRFHTEAAPSQRIGVHPQRFRVWNLRQGSTTGSTGSPKAERAAPLWSRPPLL